MSRERVTDGDLRALMEFGLARGEDGTTIDGETLARIVTECQDHRRLLDAARCRITALGLYEIASLVKQCVAKLPE